MYKLKPFGIFGKILLLIKEFLNDRSFAVKLNNYVSQSLPVISSVPQGLKLGLLPYILNAWLMILCKTLNLLKLKCMRTI